jgi:hypothetical protein
LFERIWGIDSLGDISTITVHVRKIREKIEQDPSRPEFIETLWGVGLLLAGVFALSVITQIFFAGLAIFVSVWSVSAHINNVLDCEYYRATPMDRCIAPDHCRTVSCISLYPCKQSNKVDF